MCVCDVLEYLRMADSKLFNCTPSPSHNPIASHIYFQQKSTILVCVLEDIVMPFPYAQTTFVNAPLFHEVFSVFCVHSRLKDIALTKGHAVCLRVSKLFVSFVYFLLVVFGCQYQCNRLSRKARLWNELLCVEWDVKPHTLAHWPKNRLIRK